MTVDAPTAPAAVMPKAYASFAPVLDQLSEPMQQVVFGQLAQFERLARNLETQDLAEQGEFEGLGGLSARGDIAQMLQSEWLLRTEAPLEFLRRLAESETLYLEKQYADPGVRQVYRAMISVGPGALGHGRLVALAALFFMARLAERRGALFHWCFLPRTEGAVWFDTVTTGNVERLLRAASYREMSQEDVDEAVLLWAALTAPTGRKDQPRPIDWIIGVRPRKARAGSGEAGSANAVEAAPGAVAFALQAPAPGEPRAVGLVLRERGRERTRGSVSFPDDRICVSALRDPFRPLASRQHNLPPTGPREPIGWAPRYFASIGSHRVVRLNAGLLIFRIGEQRRVRASWFIPLDADTRLAGLRLQHGQTLTVIAHRQRPAGARLVSALYNLIDNAEPSLLSARTTDTPVEQLFRNQPAFVLPLLAHGVGQRFYSTSGHAFELDWTGASTETRFTPLYKAPRIVSAGGAFQVVREEVGGTVMLRAIKAGGGRADSFVEGLAQIALDHLYGFAYSRSERSLAYSLSPDRWTVCDAVDLPDRPNHRRQPDRTIQVESHETVLSGKPQPTGASARVWSDARRGGDGTVLALRELAGGVKVRKPIVKLGEHALDIVKVEIGDDGGVWALAVDGEGEPARLLHYHRKNRTGLVAPPYELATIARSAIVIDLDRLDG